MGKHVSTVALACFAFCLTLQLLFTGISVPSSLLTTLSQAFASTLRSDVLRFQRIPSLMRSAKLRPAKPWDWESKRESMTEAESHPKVELSESDFSQVWFFTTHSRGFLLRWILSPASSSQLAPLARIVVIGALL
ncbi:hypothetical protein IWZ00DRAFT_566717 [Phyllosticta capitalensis]